MRSANRFYTFIIVFLFVGCHATAEGIRDLINQDSRPTISQLRQILASQDFTIPFPESADPTHIAPAGLLVARMIAEIEKVYPNAVILPIGRDSADLGDMIDAFYQNLGQEGRVRRFNASRPTITSATQATIVDYLKTLGFDLKNITLTRPFVLLDRTRGQSNSQAVVIRDAIYQVYLQKGGTPGGLANVFNIVSTAPQVGVLVGGRLKPSSLDLHQTFFAVSFPNPLEQQHKWHDQFLTLVRDGSGIVHSTTPSLTSNVYARQQYMEHRRMILNEMVEMIRITRLPFVRDAVSNAAQALGYEFPLNSGCAQSLLAE